MNRPEKQWWLNDAGRIEMPREFASSFDDRTVRVSGVSDQQWAVLERGPDHPDYWTVWDVVFETAVITDGNDVVYHLHQDGDLWLVPNDVQWSEEAKGFVLLDPPVGDFGM